MRSTIIVTSILFVAVIVAAIFYFADLRDGGQPLRRPLRQIPDDAVFITSFPNDDVLDEIFSGFGLFKAVLGDDHYGRLTYIQKSILRDAKVADQTAGQEILLSFHPGKSTLDYLMALPTKERIRPEALFEIMETIDAEIEPQWTDSVSQQVFRLQLPDDMPPLYVTELDGVLYASFSSDLIARTADKRTPKLKPEAVERFRERTNDSSPLTWYINHERIFGFASAVMRNKPGSFIRLTEGLSGYSTLHMNFRHDAFMFSGSSAVPSTDTAVYLSLYTEQSPIEQTLEHVFPANTASFIAFSVSDYSALHAGITDVLTRRKEIAQMREQHRLIRNSSGVSIQEELLPEWGDEFAVLQLANREELAIIKVKDSLALARTVQRISTTYPEGMYRLNHSNLLYYSFGDPLKPFARPYFLLIGPYLVCANHTSTLRRFQSDYAAGKRLGATPGYIDFDKLQANKSTVTVFVNNENAADIISSDLGTVFRSAYTDEEHYGYQQFYGWSIQLSGSGEGFFTNINAKYISEDTPGAAPAWTFPLNGTLEAGPAVCIYDDTSRFILAQDASHILHAVSTVGEKLWNAQLPGPVLGPIRQLSDSSIVVTTAERLYRFDAHGDPLPGFSRELQYRATYAATVYEDGEDSRIYVPAGNRILAFDNRGQALPEWKNVTLNNNILFDLQAATVGDIRYLIAATESGTVYFLNHNGQRVGLAESSQRVAWRNPMGVHAGDGGPENVWVAITDTAGSLHRVSFNRSRDTQPFGQLSSDHTFDAVNITGAPTPEWVFTDRGQLSVYQADGKPVYHFDFGQSLAGRPMFFHLDDGTHLVGAATQGNGLIYVFNTDGTVISGFPAEGSAPFYYGKLDSHGGTYLLCSRDDRTLYCFRFD